MYQYFPSKEALVAALVARHMDEMSAEIASAIGRLMAMPLTVAVREIVALLLRAHASRIEAGRGGLTEEPRAGPHSSWSRRSRRSRTPRRCIIPKR